MDSAIGMVKVANQAIGQPPPPGSSALWTFIDDATRDLAGRMFGSIPTNGNHRFKYHIIKSMFGCDNTSLHPLTRTSRFPYIHSKQFRFSWWRVHRNSQHWRRSTHPVKSFTQQLTDQNHVIYCDLSRLEKLNSVDWGDKNNPAEPVWSKKSYDTCNGLLTAANTALSTAASGRYGIITLCPKYIKQV